MKLTEAPYRSLFFIEFPTEKWLVAAVGPGLDPWPLSHMEVKQFDPHYHRNETDAALVIFDQQ